METSPKVSSLPGASGSWNVAPSLTASPSPRVPPQEFAESLRAGLNQFAQEVMEAVNGAADGKWIAGSEEEVRDRCAKMSQRVFERALQKRVDAAEAAFPPPHDPTTNKRSANKGRQSHRVLTINGEIKVTRRWWHGSQLGSVAPADALIDRRGATITPGVAEMGCRVNLTATSFAEGARVLERTAQLSISKERLRQLVEAIGREVLRARQSEAAAVAWRAPECVVSEGAGAGKTRVDMGCDGVMVPVITEAEKVQRRRSVNARRRRCGKKRRPSPPRKRGADLPWKEFQAAFFYSEDGKRRYAALTHGNHESAGRLLRREADRLRFRQADERIALVDGAVWIGERMR